MSETESPLDQIVPQTETEGKRLGALKGLDVLSQPADAQDVDPQAWLGTVEQDLVGTVVVDNVRLKIAALTEAETQSLLKRCRRPDPRNPTAEPKLDAMMFRLESIALSLNKANPSGSPVVASQLQGRKTGTLTKIQDAIMALSGMDTTRGAASASFFD